MPPLHHHIRGQCHDSTPLLLSAPGLGTPVALWHVVSGVAKPQRASSTAAHYPQHVTTHTRQGASTVWRLDAQASLCPVRPRSDASHATASGTTRSDATAPPPPTGHRHREALLSAYGLCLPRLVGAGQPARQRPSQRWPVASIPLYGLPRLLSRASRHPVSWQARLGRPPRTRHRLPRRGPGHPRDGAGLRDRSQHGAQLAHGGSGPTASLLGVSDGLADPLWAVGAATAPAGARPGTQAAVDATPTITL